MIRVLVIILIILAALFLIGGGYLLGLPRSNPKTESATMPIPSILATVSPSVTVVSIPSVSATPKPVVDTITAIENAFVSGNFESLNPNLAESVMLIAYATSCCGATTDYQKVADFISGYVKKGKNWTFNPKDAKYNGLKELGDLFVVSDDGRVLVFKLNDAKKLEKVTFYSSYLLAAN